MPAYPHGRVTPVLHPPTQQPYRTDTQDFFFVCKLAIAKSFDRLTMWDDVWPDI